jgi:protease-4
LIEIDGVIESGGEVDSDTVNQALRDAFKNRQTAAVVMRINSPGGSPVQAGIISDEIRRLRKLYPSIPLYAVVEEMCASGGYYLAATADRIFVDKASLVGSIGVVMQGFGLTELMDKAGVERRLLTAGKNKGFLDSFSPLSPEHKSHAQAMLDEIHQQFIRVVRDGRGARLKESPDLFSGLFWTGERSIELGLADELGSLDSVARDVVKAEDIVDFTRRDNLAERLARRLGTAMGGVIGRELRLLEDGVRLR